MQTPPDSTGWMPARQWATIILTVCCVSAVPIIATLIVLWMKLA